MGLMGNSIAPGQHAFQHSHQRHSVQSGPQRTAVCHWSNADVRAAVRAGAGIGGVADLTTNLKEDGRAASRGRSHTGSVP